MKSISKSIFLSYLACNKDAWFRFHMPELKEFEVPFATQKMFDEGDAAEQVAAGLGIFKGFVEVKERGKEAKKQVDKLLKDKVPAIYQPTFEADGFLCRCDMLVFNKKSKKWDLYEIKSSGEMHLSGDRDHISDAAFQMVVLEKYGVDVGKANIVHLNKEYVRKGDLEIEKLFMAEDCTELVEARKATIKAEMEQARKYLNLEKEPGYGCECLYNGRSRHCATFGKSHPEVPEYSVHDIVFIGHKKKILKGLVENGILHLHDIEDMSGFDERQANQIEAHKTQKEKINKEEIANIISGYSYPLYFLDYETFAPAIPIYDGYKPHERMPIQFSLHFLEKKGGELKHFEYLHGEDSDPSKAVAKHLIEQIDPKGTVLSWTTFEEGVTGELAERLPAERKALERICGQIQDLMEVFIKQHYVHKDFRGRTKIETVMNVLLPEMTYDHLPYTGADVGYVWWECVNGGKDKEKKMKLIWEYCKQDTFVMVEIFRILNEMVGKKPATPE